MYYVYTHVYKTNSGDGRLLRGLQRQIRTAAVAPSPGRPRVCDTPSTRRRRRPVALQSSLRGRRLSVRFGHRFRARHPSCVSPCDWSSRSTVARCPSTVARDCSNWSSEVRQTCPRTVFGGWSGGEGKRTGESRRRAPARRMLPSPVHI